MNDRLSVRLGIVFCSLAFVGFLIFSNVSRSVVYACHQGGPDPVGCPTITPTPTSFPSATPTDIPTGTPTAIPTASASATATPTATPRGANRIKICHATDSHSNPYSSLEVDQDSVDGNSGNDNGQGDHYLEHRGLVWFPGIANHSWGDIIPPIENVHSGWNWDSQGQEIWNNSCNILTSTPAPTPGHTESPQGSTSTSSSGTGGTSSQGQVLGTSTVLTPQVLGATGSSQDMLALLFSIGAFTSGIGVRKYAYAKHIKDSIK